MPSPRRNQTRATLMRNLGEFFGHITRGVRSDPGPPPTPETPRNPPVSTASGAAPQAVRTHTLEQRVDTPEGQMILRRTIIDELHREENPPAAR